MEKNPFQENKILNELLNGLHEMKNFSPFFYCYSINANLQLQQEPVKRLDMHKYLPLKKKNDAVL